MITKNKTYDILFGGMNEYMFYAEKVSKLKCYIESKTIVPKLQDKNVYPMTKSIDTSFFPRQEDTLFWCFYIIKEGVHKYEMCKSSSFKTEKEFKIDSVELLRENKDKLKCASVTGAKIKLANIESELVNDRKISFSSLLALSIIYEVSIFLISGFTCYDFNYAKTEGSPRGVIIYDKKTKKASVKNIDGVGEFINKIKKTHFNVSNPEKPINAMSSYSLTDLQEICRNISIPIMRINGKKETKKTLYELILLKIDC